MLIPAQYTAGTVKSRQHTEMTSPAFTDTDHIRFQSDGRLATIPAYSQAGHSLVGATRAIYAQRVTGSNSGDCYFFGTHSHLYVEKDGTLVNITPLTATTQNLAADPIDIVNTETEVSVNFTDIGVDNVVGDRIKLLALTTVGNITAAMLNLEHIITEIVGDDEVKIDVGTAASSTASGGGSAPGTVQYQITAGFENQVTAAGMGAGDFGGGDFGGGGQSTTGTQSFPRIWSFDAFGDDVVMCPGDYAAGEGQYIYLWDGNTAIAPTVLSNAPTDCNWVLVVNNSIVALCGRTVKISALGAGTTWSGLSYREKTLERVELANSGFRHSTRNAIIHHGNGVILLKYVGGADIWDFSDLFEDDGVISPQATTRLQESLIWRGRTGFYIYDGGVVQRINNEQNEDWIIKNINPSSVWHSFMYADTEHDEVYLHFATGSSGEPSDYVIVGNGTFTLGKMTRTAAQRPSIFEETFYLASDGDVYRHFTRGAVTYSWYARTSFGQAGEGETRLMLNEFRPDSNQSGDITLEIFSKEYGQSTEVSYGTWTITPTTEVISVKAAGRLISLRFSGSTEATLGSWEYNVRTMGRRKGAV